MKMRGSTLKLWLLLHATAWSLHPCSAQSEAPPVGGESLRRASDHGVVDRGNVSMLPVLRVHGERVNEKYYYLHNETRIAMATAEAELELHQDGGPGAGSATFPNFDQPPEDGCKWNTVAPHLSFHHTRLWDDGKSPRLSVDSVEILAVDSCTEDRNVQLGQRIFEFCSQKWVTPEPEILKDDLSTSPQPRSFKVFVKIRAQGLEILAEGIHFLATGKMHLVGCTRWQNVLHFDGQLGEIAHWRLHNKEFRRLPGRMVRRPSARSVWIVPGSRPEPPLNESSPEDCAVSATLQYPPLNARWNSDRVVEYSIRSTRAEDDPLYFPSIKRRFFFPYDRFHLAKDGGHAIQWQRRLETWGRVLIPVLGLVCVALQIEHGRKNEESLPFVSLVMLGIQLAHHLSQTSIFKDLQIGRFHRDLILDSVPGFNYYGTMAWAEHVPYQAMAMIAIFMYVWIFHKVGDRRRIMQLRVRRGRAGAKDPPSDCRVMYATVAIFVLVGFPGFFAIGADLYGNPSNQDSSPFNEEQFSPFVSSRLYELLQEQWMLVNNLTGLMVSLFLVPQVLGNMQWELRGRPLSVWFYAGIPFLQSLPRFFSIAKHFQLLPIFPLYDPYLNSVYGVFEDPDPWWQVGVVLCSALQVLVVHYQFARPRLCGFKAPTIRTCDLL